MVKTRSTAAKEKVAENVIQNVKNKIIKKKEKKTFQLMAVKSSLIVTSSTGPRKCFSVLKMIVMEYRPIA